MNEKPILFSGPMVRAILEGRKTQTRRVMKMTIETSHDGMIRFSETMGGFIAPHVWRGFVACPYGDKGDQLWVRETWRRADGLTVYYKADEPENKSAGWRSPQTMPYRFSRLKLEISDVRVERLQDISEGDARAQGVLCYGDLDPAQTDYKNYEYNDKFGDDWGLATAAESFQSLWAKTRGKRALWNSNPWVWVLTFRNLST